MVGQGKLSSQAYADLVDDAVTDGFMVFSQWWAQGRTDARQPLPLLVRLAQQCLRTALRKVNYQPREVALEEAILATGEASASTPVLVDSVLSTMPPREATALRGRYLDGDSMRTLGVRLQTTEAGAKCVLYRARHHFYAAWMEEPTPMTRGGGHEA
jgi:DNA-directed RNA polymerase specialized sigma24 family protein